jgi:hypothetical protein
MNSRNRAGSVMKARLIRGALLLGVWCIGSGARSAEEKLPIIVGAFGGTNARPLSIEWLDYWSDKYPFGRDDHAPSHLVVELVRSERIDTDSWSQRTEAEIRAAIKADSDLRKNTWSEVRCSKRGCIAAIDPLAPADNVLMITFASRLLANITPRGNLSHDDIAMSEHDGDYDAKVNYGTHFLFFLFPAASDGGASAGKAENKP